MSIQTQATHRRLRPVSYLILSVSLVAATVLSAPAPTASPATAVLLPWYTNDTGSAHDSYARLSQCLTEKGVFMLLPRDQAEAAVKDLHIDLERTFGLSDDEFKQIGQHLGVDFVMGGAFTIMKTLTFSGFRKDVTSNLRLHQTIDGAEVGYYLSNTGFNWVKSQTATDASAMGQAIVDTFCNELSADAARGFKKAESDTNSDPFAF